MILFLWRNGFWSPKVGELLKQTPKHVEAAWWGEAGRGLRFGRRGGNLHGQECPMGMLMGVQKERGRCAGSVHLLTQCLSGPEQNGGELQMARAALRFSWTRGLALEDRRASPYSGQEAAAPWSHPGALREVDVHDETGRGVDGEVCLASAANDEMRRERNDVTTNG